MDINESDARLVLIVDDDPDIAQFIEVILRDDGFEVEKATAGLKGFERTREVRPDLIVSNVMMSEIDGFEMTQRIRADPVVGNTPIMLLTAKALPADKRLGLVSGADDYLIKPFDPLELKARVDAMLRRCRGGGYRRLLEGNESATEKEALEYLASLERDAERDT